MTRTLLLLAAILLAGCTNLPAEIESPPRLTVAATQDRANGVMEFECPELLSGYIQGRVIPTAVLEGEAYVSFLASGDSTIIFSLAEDGEFMFPCVYPSSTFELCFGRAGQQTCTSVEGPEALGVELHESWSDD